MLSLKKNPLFAMLDTETIFVSKKRAYEIALVIFDSVTCEVLDKKRWYIQETLRDAVYYQLRTGQTPIFWPARLNALSVFNDPDCVTWEDAKADFLTMLKKHDVWAIIAHNVNFDLSAIYSTDNIYAEEPTNEPFLSHLEKLELSGYFVYGLPSMVAYNAPFKVRSGCVTFKADYLVPLLTNGIQAHDALGDCLNQLALYKLAKGQYTNTGTIYGNMLKHHKLKHDDLNRLGNSSLD